MTATGLLNRVLESAGAGGSPPSEADMLACLDEARAMVVRDLEGALATLDRLEGLVDSIGSGAARARLGSARGHALNYATRFEEAAAVATAAAELGESIGSEGEAARAWMVLVHAFAKLGRLGDALGAALRAERAFTGAGDPALASQALCNAGIVTRMMGDGDGAIGMFERALSLTEHPPATRAQIESGLAEAMLDVGRFADAEAAFLRSAETFESAGIGRAASIVRGNLADLYGRQGRLSAAIEQFEVARRFFEEDRASGELGRILTEQADVYAATGLADDAIAGYRRAGELLEQAGAVQEWARSLTGLGRMLTPRDPEGAVEAFDRAAALHDAAGNIAGAALARLHRARLDIRRGLLDEAESAVSAAAGALEGRASDSILCGLTNAEILSARGEHGRAESVLTGIMEAAGSLGLPVYLAEALWRRASARRASGDLESAIGDAREAIELIERVRGTLRGSRFRAGLLGGNRDVYEVAVGLMLERGASVEAFETTERARGRTLLDLLGGGAELEPIAGAEDAATQRLLRELAGCRAELNAVYSGHDPAARVEAHRAWQARVHDAEVRLTGLETRLHSSRRGRELLGVPEPFERIAGELSDEHGLVSYWLAEGGLHVFVLRRGGVDVVRLPSGMEEVESAVQDVHFQVGRGLVRGPGGPGGERRAQACRGALARLHGLIWGPIADRLEGLSRVSIVPAGPLHAAPFAALHDGERYLIESVEPLLLPTASVLPLIGRSGGGGGRGVCVIAVPDRLAPEIEAEASALRDALPDADVLVGASATADEARARASTAGVLHFACHGAFPPSNPLAAGLKLADRWITVRDVLSWRLPGSEIVLSGCDTGRHTLESGEELFGFGRGFLASGARGLVMSLWRAHDATTSGLMSEMYRTLNGVVRPGCVRPALVSAQRSQIGAGVHPAFWSNFVYMGV